MLGYFAPSRESARERYRELTEDSDGDDSVPRSDGVIAGSDDFVRSHLRGVEPSSDIPASHRRAPSPSIQDILSDRDGSDAIARAYEHGYTMPAIARYLRLHPSTVSRRLARMRAQIKT